MAKLAKTVPTEAKRLLDFIAQFEAPGGYGVVYGNKQKGLEKPLIQWTVDEIINANPSFYKRHGSSAAGRYQFMRNTLVGLRQQFPEIGGMRFAPELQDRLGFELLKRRGFEKYMSGQLSLTAFGLALAQEWASLPVLKAREGAHRWIERGDSYYKGDAQNKAHARPEAVEAILRAIKAPADTAWGPVPLADYPEIPAVEATPGIAAVPAPVTASRSPTGVLSGIWALLQGKPPVKAADRSDVRAEVKAEVPSLSKELGGLRLAGLLTGFGGLLGGAQDTGLLDTLKGAADQASDTAQSVQQLVNLIFGLIRWSVAHWWVFVLGLGIYMLVKVGWAIYKVYAQIIHNRAMAELLRRE